MSNHFEILCIKEFNHSLTFTVQTLFQMSTTKSWQIVWKFMLLLKTSKSLNITLFSWNLLTHLLPIFSEAYFRSSCSQMFFKIDVFKDFAIFTAKHLVKLTHLMSLASYEIIVNWHDLKKLKTAERLVVCVFLRQLGHSVWNNFKDLCCKIYCSYHMIFLSANISHFLENKRIGW